MTTCTPENRCGTCRNDILYIIRTKTANARKISESLVDERMCAECDKILPIDHFRPQRYRCKVCDRSKRRVWTANQRARGNNYDKKRFDCKLGCGVKVAAPDTTCLTCYKALRRKNATGRIRVRNRSAVKPTVVVEKPKVITKKKHPCQGGCGEMLSEEALCFKCKRIKQNLVAASAEKQIKKKRLEKSLEEGKILGVMRGRYETFILQSRCRVCQRPISDTGLCYTCATGRPRTQKILPTVEYAQIK